jgi:hypothetical protein
MCTETQPRMPLAGMLPILWYDSKSSTFVCHPLWPSSSRARSGNKKMFLLMWAIRVIRKQPFGTRLFSRMDQRDLERRCALHFSVQRRILVCRRHRRRGSLRTRNRLAAAPSHGSSLRAYRLRSQHGLLGNLSVQCALRPPRDGGGRGLSRELRNSHVELRRQQWPVRRSASRHPGPVACSRRRASTCGA